MGRKVNGLFILTDLCRQPLELVICEIKDRGMEGHVCPCPKLTSGPVQEF